MQQLIERMEARMNAIARVERDDGAWWRKERGRASGVLIGVANAFFWCAGNPVRVFRLADWQRWEVACFALLHRGEYAARIEERAVLAMELPGESLSAHLDRRTLTRAMLVAAGAELRRVHALPSAEFPEGWSHGDAHLGNFIFHAAEQRARLMDFEVRHHLELPAPERHADDLCVFLQDLAGRIDAAQWLPFALAFVESYGRPEIARRLRAKLVLPPRARLFARLWWGVRTSYLPARELKRRLAELREAL